MKRVRDTGFTLVAVGGLLGGLLLAPGLSAQTINTVAGNGESGYSGDGGRATLASIRQSFGVAVDAAGNRYIADSSNFRIRKVTPAGIISTIAGTGVSGFSGDGGPATAASIGAIYLIAAAPDGTLYLPDYSNSRIRKVSPGGIITTVAGTGVYGFSGDGGPATNADIGLPYSVALDGKGNFYFTNGHTRVRKVTALGVISTVAGSGAYGFSGDGGPAINASLQTPVGLAFDGKGNMYIADYYNYRIRKVDPAGVISTVAGSGVAGFAGDGGPATAARLNESWDMKADGVGNLYISDTGNNRIRKVSTSGVITTYAGNGFSGFSGDGGPARDASLEFPAGISVVNGRLHVLDSSNYRLRKIDLFSTCAAEGFSGSQLTLCKLICEVQQPPAVLSSLISGYTVAFRSDPPCAR